MFPLFLYGIEPEKDRITVMDVQDEDKLFDKKTVTRATDYIFSKFDSTRLFWMVPKSDRDVALDQAIDETLEGSRRECVDEKCQMSLVAQLQANFLINTKIKKLYQGTCNISISKFDVEKRAGVGTWSAKFNCAEKGLYEAIDGFNFGDASRESTSFQTGKTGKLEDLWNPEMAGTGEQIIVYFESDPSGATVSIDGEVAGQTPKFKSKMVAAGKHLIKMEKEDYYPETKIVDLKKGSKVKFSLNKGIIIETTPPDSMVRIDGVLVCQSTPCERVVDEGEREITVQKELYETKKEKIMIQRGRNILVSLENNSGLIEIKTTFSGVEVFLDGKIIGKTPIDTFLISPGPHIIEAKDNCFNSVPEQFVVEKNRKVTIDLPVIPKQAAVSVMAKDDDGNDVEAELFADDYVIGNTPGTFKIPSCTKEIKAVYELQEETKPLFLKEKEERNVKFVFSRKYYEKKKTPEYKKPTTYKPDKTKKSYTAPYKPYASPQRQVKTNTDNSKHYRFGFLLGIGGAVHSVINKKGNDGGIGMDVPVGLKYGPFMWLVDFDFYYNLNTDENDKLYTDFRYYNINGIFRYYFFEYNDKNARGRDKNLMKYFGVFSSIGSGYFSLEKSNEFGIYGDIGMSLTKFFEFKTSASYGTFSNSWVLSATLTFNITSWIF